MRNVLVIFEREFIAYFNGALAYIIIPVFLLMVGAFSLYFRDVFDLEIVTMRPIYFWCSLSFLLLIPALTMRAFAEELRTGSYEMLSSLPISPEQMVLGKYLAALALMTIALALTLTYPYTLSQVGDLDIGPVLGGYLGLFMLGAAFCAIGVAASASTQSQVIAFVIALLVGLVPFALGYALSAAPGSLLPLLQHLSFDYHFSQMAKGIIDTRQLIYYGSVIALFLHFAVFQLRRRRLK